MRKFLSMLAIAGLAVFVACTNPARPSVAVNNSARVKTAAPTPAHNDDGHDAPRISLADAKKDFDAGTALFVDTHAPAQFAIQHIRGAINIPANEIGTKADNIPKGKKIIAYCS
jgi:hypothetical protein